MIDRSVRTVLDAATQQLTAAGVASPRFDAEELLAFVVGATRTRLFLHPPIDDVAADRYGALINRRARRVPLQYLTGSAPFGPIDVAVGPGVFVPRPETEWLLEFAAENTPRGGVVLDLCTGSGAIALGIAAMRPDCVVHAVEIDASAWAWASRNVAEHGSRIFLHRGDVTDPAVLRELDASVDVVVSNPPYIPDDTNLEPEVARHDPTRALFGGTDGTDVIAAMIPNIGRWLRPAGVVGIEHDDTNSEKCLTLLKQDGRFTGVSARTDLAGKPRFVVASKFDAQQVDREKGMQ